MKVLFFFAAVSIISCGTAKQSSNTNSLYDFLIIKEKFQNNWIDKEIDIFLFLGGNNKILNFYSEGLEDNYISCFHTGTFYSTDNKIQKISLQNFDFFKDVSVFSDTDLPFSKQNQHKFLINGDIIKVFKVRLNGCINNWQSIDIKSKNSMDLVLLPINIESYRLTKRDKIFIEKKLEKTW